MDRKEKLQFLKSVLAGKSILELMPKVRVCFIEREPGKYLVCLNGNYKYISVDKKEAFIQKLRLENPLKIVEVNIMEYEEYLIVNEKFENEY